MTLTLHFHPLSSFSQKVLIALYENGTPFTPEIVDLTDAAALAAYKKLSPHGKIPVLRDEGKDRTVPETSIIIEYLQQHYPGPAKLIPDDSERARQTRFGDRFFDLYVSVPMQKIVFDKLRPPGKNDHHGVEEAKAMLRTSLGMIDAGMKNKTWAIGDEFTMADCAAAPALFYVSKLLPFADTHKHTARYLDRLMARPSYARALAEAQPYFAMFPG